MWVRWLPDCFCGTGWKPGNAWEIVDYKDGYMDFRITATATPDWMEQIKYPNEIWVSKKKKSRRYSSEHDLVASWPHKTIGGVGIIGMLVKNDRRKAVLRRK